jgi:hypothetical protein
MGGASVGAEVRQRRMAGLVGLLALAAILAVSWMLQRPPAPVPASAPAAVFSAQRVYADLQHIAGPEPTPIGSAGSDAVRGHLAAALSASGFSVEMRTSVGSRTFHSTTVAGRVDNVVATWPGYDSTGQVLLTAHYGNLGSRAWPYELRFYDPPPDGFVLTLQSRGVGLPRLYVSDFTVGLEWLPGFRQRPAGLDRSPDHSSDTVVLGRTFRP